MDTVTEFRMMKTMYESGSAGFLHRFLEHQEIIDIIKQAYAENFNPIVVSVGVKPQDYTLVDKLLEGDKSPHVILIDIAHGDSEAVDNMIKYIKHNSDIDVIAGNVATAEAAERMCKLKVNAIRVGIGGSTVCTTRIVTGHGMPTLQSIIDCYEVTKKYDIPIIADGGFKTSGDIVKALAFGAESVSLGTLLAATSDSPGVKINDGGEQKKKMYGMASKEAQTIHRNGLKNGTAPEGISITLPYKGDTIDTVNELLGGIRSGLTYSGATSILEMREKAEYVFLSTGGINESKLTGN